MSDTSQTVRNIRIINAAPDTGRIQGRPATVLRGSLAPDFFDSIVVPDYQREAMKHHKHDELVEVLDPKDGIGIPDDLLLCVRTADFRQAGSGELIIPVTASTGPFLLDGHQRHTAAMARIARRQSVDPFGVKIFLGTALEEEIRTFYQVNRKQTKVSTDVLLRNSGTNVAIEALQRLVKDNPGMPSVKWGTLKNGEQITARMLYEIAVVLHGRPRYGKIEQILEDLLSVSDKFGTDVMTQNVKTFFETVDKCFDGRPIERFKYHADMLRALAAVFWGHLDFWNGDRLVVRVDDIRKIGQTPVRSLESDLRGKANSSQVMHTLVRQIDKGRDTNRLQQRI